MLSLVGLVDVNQVDNLMIDVELIATLPLSSTTIVDDAVQGKLSH